MKKSSVMYLLLGFLLIPIAALAQTKDVDVVKESVPKVVMIEVSGIVDGYETDESTFTTKMPVGWLGSGSIISSDGMILSCDHLFSRKLEERLIIVKMSNGRKYRAIVLAEDYKKDLSLLKIFPMRKLPYFTLGNTVVRGQKVFAFGAPLGYDKTVSVGYVQNTEVGKDKTTMHSASLNPGNSGGPLVTEDGQLVGVNVSILLVNFLMRAEGMGQSTSLKDVRWFLKDR
jgi:S1-C subfamily serine protease